MKILSFDGGGVRGVISAVILVELEKRLKDRKINLFDVIDMFAGTSTGSIIAAGLAIRKSPQDILNIYKKRAREIFPYQSRWSPERIPLLFKSGFSAPKFDNIGLINALKEEFGNVKFENLDKKVLIISYDTIERNAVIFKSWKSNDDSSYYGDIPVWEICTASASAPSFFPSYHIIKNQKEMNLIDGGTVANNPSACALASAIKLSGNTNHKLISIGTGDPIKQIKFNDSKDWGAIEWAIPIIDVMFDGSSDANRYITEQVIGIQNYSRLQFNLKKENEDLDNSSSDNIEDLIKLTEKYINDNNLLINRAVNLLV